MYQIQLNDMALPNLHKLYIARMFTYQRKWARQPSDNRTLHLTKARMCGADWLFTLEAFLDALHTGRDQIFLSDDEGLLNVSHGYFTAMLNTDGIESSAPAEIQGDATVYCLPGGARVSFLMAGPLMAGQSGNVYVPEYAWTQDPEQLRKLAEILACHKRHRKAYYTTPSRSFAAGQAYKKIISSPSTLCHSLTVMEALNSERSPYSPALVDSLRRTMSSDDFDLAYMCQWQTVVA